jgi:hypothetical protein
MSDHCKTLIIRLSRHYCDEDDDDANRNVRKRKDLSFKIASGTVLVLLNRIQTRRKDLLTCGRIDGMRHHRNVMMHIASADYY